MHNVLSAFALITCVASGLHAQEHTIAITANWKKGDYRNYVVLQEKQTFAGDSLIETDTTRYAVMQITVADSIESVFELSCLTQSAQLSDKDVRAANPAFQALIEQYGQLTYRYLTDGTGVFLETTNADEIDAFADELFDRIGEGLVERDTAGIVAEALATWKEIQVGGFAQVFTPEIGRFHFPYGRRYQLGDTLYYEDETFIPALGTTLPSRSSIWLDGIDQEKKNCIIKVRMVPDEGVLHDISRTVIEDFIKAADLDQEVEDQRLAEMEMQLRDGSLLTVSNLAEYVFDYENGWPLSISVKMVATIHFEQGDTYRSVFSICYQQIQ
ncbi:hypothetical protein [Parapedobacter koreensis]|uniref:Uncharacterized protein n=1 Tax=Parapedobacter koreensis TaxID=332977 RepID=A0A1H7FJC3_9SPHI|nr:hypothetical protein [Parapedobacter koreensis]SEK26131.1 hypothetical protein SAMN05421740_101372 [Parapedobacter koreensis]